MAKQKKDEFLSAIAGGGPVEVFCKIDPALAQELLDFLAGTPQMYVKVHRMVQGLLEVLKTKTTQEIAKKE